MFYKKIKFKLRNKNYMAFNRSLEDVKQQCLLADKAKRHKDTFKLISAE